jgi:uncharacterized protein (TIGR01777 family)
MNITITGATGFMGKPLVQELRRQGHTLHVLGRRPIEGMAFSPWNSSSTKPPPEESLATADAIVHLAGESVAKRWNPEVKKGIRDSRINGTRALVNALSTQSKRPAVLVSGSAVGYYGDRGDEVLTESSTRGKGFLADVTAEWEAAADLAGSLGIRVVKLRTGIVLGKRGGALEQMLPPFKVGMGGRLGSGQQWMSWIHMRDIVGLILFAINESNVGGALNGTAPQPLRNSDFTAVLAKTLHRPAVATVPKFALQLMFGETASVLLGSARAIPKAAESAGYKFQFSELGAALADLVGPK